MRRSIETGLIVVCEGKRLDTEKREASWLATPRPRAFVACLASMLALGLLACAENGDSGGTESGSAGAEEGSGSAGAEGGAADDGGADPSAGCGKQNDDVEGTWTEHTIDVAGTERIYDLFVPQGYDDRKAYPVVYEWHGCNSNEERENNNVPVENSSGDAAILVRGRAIDTCWDTNAEGADIAFADALVETIEAAYCVDPDRRFATGYSSGSFMTHQLSCLRGDVYRGVASVAGGTAGSACTGQTAALLIHDSEDPQVDISASEGALARHIESNGCDPEDSQATEPDPCVAYEGCDVGYPVVWCVTSGEGHGRQDALAGPAFWAFLSGL